MNLEEIETSSRILERYKQQNRGNTGQATPSYNEHIINNSVQFKIIGCTYSQYWIVDTTGSFYTDNLCLNVSGDLNNTIVKLKNLDKNKNTDNAIDMAFDWIEDKFKINSISSVDTFISFILNEDFSFYFLVAILTTTVRYKDELKNRSLLHKKAKEVGLDLTSDIELLNTTLHGL